MAPRSATKAAGSAAAKARSDPMKQLSEMPGVLEEGKIFFLYRYQRGQRTACISHPHACPTILGSNLLWLYLVCPTC